MFVGRARVYRFARGSPIATVARMRLEPVTLSGLSWS